MTPFDILRQALVDGPLADSLRADPDGSLQRLGVADPAVRQDMVQMFGLLAAGAASQNLMGQQLQDQFKGTLAVATEMKHGLKRTIDQIDRAYRSTMLMYQVTFYMGILLILAAVATAALGRTALLPAVFGTLGMADLLAFFLVRPQERLQASRSSLAQVQAALYNWFNDSFNLNTLMGVHSQAGRHAEAAALSESLMTHTEKTLEMLQKYCKLDER